MASKLEQAARDLAQAAIQDTAGGILTQEITTELKSVVAATKSLEKSVDKGNSATSAELARIAQQSQSGLDKSRIPSMNWPYSQRPRFCRPRS